MRYCQECGLTKKDKSQCDKCKCWCCDDCLYFLDHTESEAEENEQEYGVHIICKSCTLTEPFVSHKN